MKIYKADKQKKFSTLALCLLLTVVFTVGGTLAYLYTQSQQVTNTFQPAEVGNFVDEDFKDNVKENVRIQNSINGAVNDKLVDAYIRATYIVTWRKGNEVKPAELGDYTVTLNLDNAVSEMDVEGKWVKNGSYYYFTGIVAPGGYTDILIDSIAPVAEEAPDGYTLHVEIVSQSIQAEGTNASGNKPVVLAWGVDPAALS